MATWKGLSGAVMVIGMLGSGTLAGADTLVGLVTSVSGDTLQVKSKDPGARSVTLDAQTKYLRWITHQPWQQSTVADRRLVTVGRCVGVELKAGDDGLAKLVRVNLDEPGSIYCPCRSSR